MLEKYAEELINRIDNLNDKEKKNIIKYAWKNILELSCSDNTHNEIIRTLEDNKELKNLVIKKIYIKYIKPQIKGGIK